jgi:hypothetical protein
MLNIQTQVAVVHSMEVLPESYSASASGRENFSGQDYHVYRLPGEPIRVLRSNAGALDGLKSLREVAVDATVDQANTVLRFTHAVDKYIADVQDIANRDEPIVDTARWYLSDIIDRNKKALAHDLQGVQAAKINYGVDPSIENLQKFSDVESWAQLGADNLIDSYTKAHGDLSEADADELRKDNDRIDFARGDAGE